MALKDWQKETFNTNIKNLYRWTKYGRWPTISVDLAHGIWYVYLNSDFDNEKFKSKSKSQALKFAKQYMRTH